MSTIRVICILGLPAALLAACDPAGGGSPTDEATQTSGSPAPVDGRTIDPTSIVIPRPLEGTPTAQAAGSTSPTDEAAAARAILTDPAAYKPETYVLVTKFLWERGDRLQAAFWHFLFQIRTLPWLDYDRQLGPLRSGVNASIGATINDWLGSDYDAWLQTTRRAMAYERRMPMSPLRPAGASEAAWAASVARGRQTWEDDFRQITGPSGPTRASIEAQRRSNGKYVGPLRDPGATLPADWR